MSSETRPRVDLVHLLPHLDGSSQKKPNHTAWWPELPLNVVCQVFKLKFSLSGQRFHIEGVQENVLGAIRSDMLAMTWSSLCPCLFSVFLKYSTHLEQSENVALLGRVGPKYKITKDKPRDFRSHQIVGQRPCVPRNRWIKFPELLNLHDLDS